MCLAVSWPVATSELKKITGWGEGRRVRGQHFTELKTLNKQEINIHYVYKLQHYEPVGHITQKKNLQYLQSLILEKFSKKQWFFFFFFLIYAVQNFTRKVKETIAQTSGSVGK